jgi:hypothetical protein
MMGGTSASAPSFAGLMAIVNQYTHSANGNPAARLYSLTTSPRARTPSLARAVPPAVRRPCPPAMWER